MGLVVKQVSHQKPMRTKDRRLVERAVVFQLLIQPVFCEVLGPTQNVIIEVLASLTVFRKF